MLKVLWRFGLAKVPMRRKLRLQRRAFLPLRLSSLAALLFLSTLAPIRSEKFRCPQSSSLRP